MTCLATRDKNVARIYGRKTWYNLWHSLGMIQELFVGPLVFTHVN